MKKEVAWYEGGGALKTGNGTVVGGGGASTVSLQWKVEST